MVIFAFKVSYPTEGSISDLDEQFYAFMRERQKYHMDKGTITVTTNEYEEGNINIVSKPQVRKGRENGAKASETLASVVAAAVGTNAQNTYVKKPSPTTLVLNVAAVTTGHRKSASF